MNTCPCCSYPMLRHTRSQSVYWFCRHCWQEMPDFLELEAVHSQRQALEKLIKPSTFISEKMVETRLKFKHADGNLMKR